MLLAALLLLRLLLRLLLLLLLVSTAHLAYLASSRSRFLFCFGPPVCCFALD